MAPLPSYTFGEPDVLFFIVLPLILVAVLVWGTAVAWRRAGAPAADTRLAALIVLVAALAWMAATVAMAASGALRQWNSRPPAFVLLAAGILILGIVIAWSRLGRRLATHLPLWALVAVQAFRLPLELVMHRMAERGIMPEQMGYDGWNFDIVTGATAIVVALAVRTGYAGRRLVLVWNVVGLALLVNVVAIAIVSTPVFGWFGPERLNVWVTYPPFVWLPAVMVLSALAGHLVIFRAIGLRTADVRR